MEMDGHFTYRGGGELQNKPMWPPSVLYRLAGSALARDGGNVCSLFALSLLNTKGDNQTAPDNVLSPR